MKTRPSYFVIYSILLALIALSLPIQAALITGRSFLNVVEGFLMLTPINIIMLSLCIITATLSVNASPGLKLCIPLLLITVSFNNYAIMKSGFGFDPSQVIWATAGFGIAHLPLMFGSSRVALLDPRQRWWLVPQRRLIDVPISIKTIQGFRFASRSFDVSENGIYLKIDPAVFSFGQTSFVKTMFSGGRMTIRMAVGRFQEIKCDAQVVRCQERDSGQYPAGLGIRFLNMDSKTKNEISRLLKSQFTQSSHLRP